MGKNLNYEELMIYELYKLEEIAKSNFLDSLVAGSAGETNPYFLKAKTLKWSVRLW